MANYARPSACILWLTWAALLAGGLAGRVCEGAPIAAWETELKAGSTVALVVYAWLKFLERISRPRRRGDSPIFPRDSAKSGQSPTVLKLGLVTSRNPRHVALLIAVGITLGCLGDASPMLGSWWPDPQRTLGNMLLFGLGHVAYIGACIRLHRLGTGARPTAAWYRCLAAWLILGTALWYLAAGLGSHQPRLRIPALAYTLLLSTTAGCATGNAWTIRSLLPVAIGASLFLVSDVLLAVWIFHDRVFQPFDLVWLSYGLGQMLIVYGSLCTLERLPGSQPALTVA